MERSRRTNNPTITRQTSRKGRNIVNKKGKSKERQAQMEQLDLQTAASKRKLERRKTAYANQNRKVVNEILRHGKHIKLRMYQ